MKSLNKTYYLLILGLILIVSAIYQKQANIITPSIPLVLPKTPISIPDLTNNIFYDEYNKVIELSKKHNKKIVLIFGADWCPYCKDLKKDVKNIDGLKQYIVCFIDTDKNEDLVKNYRIKSLPTSIIIDATERELARKTGYKNKDYNEWLVNNMQESSVSWMPIK